MVKRHEEHLYGSNKGEKGGGELGYIAYISKEQYDKGRWQELYMRG
jgi:hypothetical protein